MKQFSSIAAVFDLLQTLAGSSFSDGKFNAFFCSCDRLTQNKLCFGLLFEWGKSNLQWAVRNDTVFLHCPHKRMHFNSAGIKPWESSTVLHLNVRHLPPP